MQINEATFSIPWNAIRGILFPEEGSIAETSVETPLTASIL